MNAQAKLSIREEQVAELVAWGASGKEVAVGLKICPKTADNHIQKIKKKIGVGKLNEISAWWFCTHFNISFDLSPMKRVIFSTFLLCVIVAGEVLHTSDIYRNKPYRGRRTSIEEVRIRLKIES